MLHVVVMGERRFRLLDCTADPDQLLRARVNWLPNPIWEPLPASHRGLAEALHEMIEHLGEPFTRMQAEYENATWVGARLTELLPLPLPTRQALREEARLHPAGLWMVRHNLVRILQGRLRLDQVEPGFELALAWPSLAFVWQCRSPRSASRVTNSGSSARSAHSISPWSSRSSGGIHGRSSAAYTGTKALRTSFASETTMTPPTCAAWRARRSGSWTKKCIAVWRRSNRRCGAR